MQQSALPSIAIIAQTDTAFLVTKFLQDCVDRGLSPQTIRSYNDFLSKFTLAYPELPTDPEVLTKFVASFISGDERRHGCYRVLRTFYGFVDNRFDMVSNPIHKVRPPKRLPKEKKALTLGELRNLLEYPGHSPTVKTILHLLCDTGMRIGELSNIKRDDIGVDNTLRVSGKTGQRIVPLSPQVRYMLLQLKPAEDGRLFPHKSHWWSELVSRAFTQAGIKGSAHTLRHTFCTVARISDQSLMAITGHKSFSMILNYSHRREERAQEEHSQQGPLARLYGSTKPDTSNSSLQLIAALAEELGAAKEQIKYLESLLSERGNGHDKA